MTRPLDSYTDIHSHRLGDALRGDTVVCVTPADRLAEGGTYSVGIHPWDTGRPAGCGELRRLVAMARDSRVVAIGECGFDGLRGGSLEAQRGVFDFQARLAARLGKPLIIHCVRAHHLLLAAATRLRPEPGMWIVHGFRGRPEAARQLVRAGIAISLGEKFNPGVPEVVPPHLLYRETDTPR